MKLFYTIILCLIILSCGKNKENASESDSLKTAKPDSTMSGDGTPPKLENFLVGEQTDTSKVQVINYDCALLLPIAENVVKEMEKAGSSDEEIATTLDDANFYSYQASEMIDSIGVKTVMSKKQFIKFVGNQKNWTVDTYKKDLAGWNIILFKTNKEPQLAPNISVTLDLAKNYFDKK
jgi:hypothetical protein